MNVTCEKCGTTYRIDDSRIPPQGVKAKCPKCMHSFVLQKPADAGAAPPPDPFAGGGGSADPFAQAPADPFAGAASSGAPAGASAQPAGDPFAGGGDPFAGGGGAAPPPPGMGGGGIGEDPFAPGGGGGGGNLDGLFQDNKTDFRIQKSDGNVLGPFDLFTIKQMIYEQQLDGSESIEDSSGGFVSIQSNEELAEIFRLLGRGDGAGGGQPAAPMGGGGMDDDLGGGDMGAPVDPGPIGDSAFDAPPNFDLDKAAGGGVKNKMLIGVERMWGGIKNPKILIGVGGIVVVGLIALVVFTQWDAILNAVGVKQRAQAKELVMRAEPRLYSGTRGPLQNAAADFRTASDLRPSDLFTAARLAEAHAALWRREPERADALQAADAQLAKASADDDPVVLAAVLRAKIRLAIGKGDGTTAKKALDALSAAAPDDPILPFLTGELALFNGDTAGAEAAFSKAAATDLPGPTEGTVGKATGWAAYGKARVKALEGDWPAAADAAGAALTNESTHGGARVLLAFAKTRGNARTEGRSELVRHAEDSKLFSVERARANYYLGVLSEEAGKQPQAVFRYKSALASDPHDAESRTKAGLLFKKLFPTRDSNEWLKAIAVVRGSTAMEFVQQGETLLEAGNTGGALQALEQARTKDPNSARVQLALGRVYLRSDDTWPKAKANFDRALDLDQTYVDAYVYRARLHLLEGEVKEGSALARKAIELDPTSVGGRLISADIARAGQQYKKAETHYSVALKFNPDSAPSWIGLGSALLESGRATAAIPKLMKGVELAPESAEARMTLGKAYEDLVELDKASDAYGSAAKLDPKNIPLRVRVGVLKVKAGEYAEGKKKLKAALDHAADDPELHFYLALAYELTSEFDEAEDHFVRVTKLQPENHLAFHHLGGIMMQQGQGADARSYYEEALAVKPEFFETHERLADLAIDRLDYDGALKELRKVETIIKTIPKRDRPAVYKRVWLVTGNVWRERPANKDVQKARKYYRQVLRLDPKNADAHYGLGLIDVEARPKAALNSFLQALRYDKTFAEPHRDIGYLYKQINNCRASLRNFQAYVKKKPDARDRKSVEDEISYLQAECG